MTDPSKQDRIAELRRELAALEAEERGDRVPTLEEIKQMSAEEIERELERLAQARSVEDAGDDDTSRGSADDRKEEPPTVAGGARLAKAYADRETAARAAARAAAEEGR